MANIKLLKQNFEDRRGKIIDVFVNFGLFLVPFWDHFRTKRDLKGNTFTGGFPGEFPGGSGRRFGEHFWLYLGLLVLITTTSSRSTTPLTQVYY